MEKDNRRADRFQKSKKYLQKNPHSSGKRRDQKRGGGEVNLEREKFKDIARGTQKAVERGFYEHEGKHVEILISPYTYYNPQSKTHVSLTLSGPAIIEVRQSTAVPVCKEMYFQNCSPPGVLVFASAKNPGGGWLKGSQAQEESIARCSGLHEACCNSHMYAVNSNKTRRKDANFCAKIRGIYTHAITYCPQVPIFRDEEGKWEDEVYYAGCLLCPAVNASVCNVGLSELEKIMEERIDRILGVFNFHGNKCLILGSFGCGVFGNSPSMIFGIFHRLLTGKYERAFEKVVFALPDDKHIEELGKYFARKYFNL